MPITLTFLLAMFIVAAPVAVFSVVFARHMRTREAIPSDMQLGRLLAEGKPVIVEKLQFVDRIVEVPGAERIVYRALPEDTSSYVTIVELLAEAGIQPNNALTWALGREAAKLHRDHYGVPPRKVSRRKTNGTGTHDFAGYPPEIAPDVRRLIGEYTAEQDAA